MRYRWLLFGLVLLVAVSVRFIGLGRYPLGLHYDEAGIAYNAWAISLWHRDEWAQLLPISFRSFGDYKPPLVIYTLAALYWLFGLQITWVRGLSALAGVLSVVVTYLIAGEIVTLGAKNGRWEKILPSGMSKWFPLLCMLLMALSAWGITFSRVGFEQNTAYLWVNLGVYCLLKSLRRPPWLLLSIVPIVLSLYAFHTAKIFWLGFGPLFIWWEQQTLLKSKKLLLASFIVGSVLLSPLIYDSVVGPGNTRAQTLIFTNLKEKPGGAGEIAQELLANTSKYLSWRFWIGGEDAVSIRHTVPKHGVITWVEWLCLGAGLSWVFLYWRRMPIIKNLFGWWLMGLMPAILSHETPHALRSLFALTPSILLAVIGGAAVYHLVGKSSKLLARGLLSVGGVIYFIGVTGFLTSYFGEYTSQSAVAFQYGYQQVFELVNQYPNGVDKIVITDGYGQPYIYALLYNRITPESFQFGGLNDYVFMPIKWSARESNRLYIGLPQEIPPNDPQVISTITVPGTKEVVLVVAKT